MKRKNRRFIAGYGAKGQLWAAPRIESFGGAKGGRIWSVPAVGSFEVRPWKLTSSFQKRGTRPFDLYNRVRKRLAGPAD